MSPRQLHLFLRAGPGRPQITSRRARPIAATSLSMTAASVARAVCQLATARMSVRFFEPLLIAGSKRRCMLRRPGRLAPTALDALSSPP